jgi:hypothetical protein
MTHVWSAPALTPAIGASTFTVALPDIPPEAVAVMVAVPFATAVTVPVLLSTAATPGSSVDHVYDTLLTWLLAGSSAVAVKVVVVPIVRRAGFAADTTTATTTATVNVTVMLWGLLLATGETIGTVAE